jgi:hypothetical protein
MRSEIQEQRGAGVVRLHARRVGISLGQFTFSGWQHLHRYLILTPTVNRLYCE